MIGVDSNWGTPIGDLITALGEARAAFPTAKVMPNLVGNLAVVVPDDDGVTGTQVGWIAVGSDRVGGGEFERYEYERP